VTFLSFSTRLLFRPPFSQFSEYFWPATSDYFNFRP